MEIKEKRTYEELLSIFNSQATIIYNDEDNTLKAELNLDDNIDKYYKYLFLKSINNTRKVSGSKHGPHITIYNPKFQDGCHPDDLAKYNGLVVNFHYNPENIFRGGFTKGFEGYYLPIKSAEIDKIKKELGIVEKDDYKGLHVTLFTNKAFLK